MDAVLTESVRPFQVKSAVKKSVKSAEKKSVVKSASKKGQCVPIVKVRRCNTRKCPNVNDLAVTVVMQDVGRLVQPLTDSIRSVDNDTAAVIVAAGKKFTKRVFLKSTVPLEIKRALGMMCVSMIARAAATVAKLGGKKLPGGVKSKILRTLKSDKLGLRLLTGVAAMAQRKGDFKKVGANLKLVVWPRVV